MSTDRERIARAIHKVAPPTRVGRDSLDGMPLWIPIPFEDSSIVPYRQADAALAELDAIRSEQRAGFEAALDDLLATTWNGEDTRQKYDAVIAAAGFEGDE